MQQDKRKTNGKKSNNKEKCDKIKTNGEGTESCTMKGRATFFINILAPQKTIFKKLQQCKCCIKDCYFL